MDHIEVSSHSPGFGLDYEFGPPDHSPPIDLRGLSPEPVSKSEGNGPICSMSPRREHRSNMAVGSVLWE